MFQADKQLEQHHTDCVSFGLIGFTKNEFVQLNSKEGQDLI